MAVCRPVRLRFMRLYKELQFVWKITENDYPHVVRLYVLDLKSVL